MSYTKSAGLRNPDPKLRQIINFLKKKKGRALELGAGQLIESRYLASKDYQVDSYDQDVESAKIYSELNDSNINFEQKDISSLMLPSDTYDIALSLLTLPFLKKDKFISVVTSMKKSLKVGGILYISMFGPLDEWAGQGGSMIFVSRKELEDLFYDYKIRELTDEQRIGNTAQGDEKFCHLFKIIAQKRG